MKYRYNAAIYDGIPGYSFLSCLLKGKMQYFDTGFLLNTENERALFNASVLGM